MTKNIFVLGDDEFNLNQVKSVRGTDAYAFHSLSRYEELKDADEYPVREVMSRARRLLSSFPGSVDAIVGWWDFPVSTLLPILRRECGLPGPTLESLLKCEHKYWSRVEQTRSVPGYIPPFALVDPFDPQAAASLELPYPFWIKPVKAASSVLGFKIDDRQALDEALELIRKGIARLAEPFNFILEHAELPADIAGIDGWHCIAEGIISQGNQYTLEGYVHRGEIVIYGVVDSVREGRHKSSFSRYQYPSQLPEAVRARMIAATEQFLRHIEFDDSPFNVEFYWDQASDRIWLLEVNPRISKSHAPLFRMVDGAYHHQVMIDVALGQRPAFPHRQGRFTYAAKFMLREHRDATVKRTPTPEDIRAVEERFPESSVHVHVKEGARLSELKDQDSYSYEVAVLFIGGNSEAELLANYRQALDILNFEFSE